MQKGCMMNIIKKISRVGFFLGVLSLLVGCNGKSIRLWTPLNEDNKNKVNLDNINKDRVYVDNPNLKKALVILIKKVEALELKVTNQSTEIESLKYKLAE